MTVLAVGVGLVRYNLPRTRGRKREKPKVPKRSFTRLGLCLGPAFPLSCQWAFPSLDSSNGLELLLPGIQSHGCDLGICCAMLLCHMNAAEDPH